MPYTAKVSYGGSNYFFMEATETYSECVQQIVELLNDSIISYDSLDISILKGYPEDYREEHFNLTSWILRKEGRCGR